MGSVESASAGSVAYLHTPRRPRGFARKVKLDFDDSLRGNLTAFCRHYGIVDEWNRPRTAEAIRFLAYCTLFSQVDPERKALGALRVQVLMAVAHFGYRLTFGFATANYDHKPVPRQDGGRASILRYDTTMLRQLGHLDHMWRDEGGHPRDEDLALWLIGSALSDPDLHEAASRYASLANSLACEMREIQGEVEAVVNGRLAQWAAGQGLPQGDG